jgi:hypothetical protein
MTFNDNIDISEINNIQEIDDQNITISTDYKIINEKLHY